MCIRDRALARPVTSSLPPAEPTDHAKGTERPVAARVRPDQRQLIHTHSRGPWLHHDRLGGKSRRLSRQQVSGGLVQRLYRRAAEVIRPEPRIGDDLGCQAVTLAQESEQDVLGTDAVSYTHLRAHETVLDLVCRLLL